MRNFKQFIEQKLSEEDKNVKETLSRLPRHHRALVDGYKFNLQDGNTLDGDDQHVGCLDDKKKVISIAAPWHYGREFTFLHEIAHKVWLELLDPKMQKSWKEICKKDSEEMFCMAYSNYYVKNPVLKYDKPSWKEFIKNLP